MIDLLALGARHGFDADHLAAISELSAGKNGGLRGFWLGARYAVGHAVTVAAVAIIAGEAGLRIPDWAIPVTLIALGVVAVVDLVRGSGFEHEHVHVHAAGEDIGDGFHLGHHSEPVVGPHRHRHRHALTVGAVHGLGGAPAAVLASGRGIVGVLVFAVGLLLANGLVGAVAGFTTRLRGVAWAAALAGITYGMALLTTG